MTDTVLTSLITTLPLTITALATLIVGVRNGIVGRSTAKTAESVHTLVNSNTGRILQTSMIALRRVADLTKNPDDSIAADIATEAYKSHQASQKVVDDNASQPAKNNA